MRILSNESSSSFNGDRLSQNDDTSVSDRKSQIREWLKMLNYPTLKGTQKTRAAALQFAANQDFYFLVW